MRRTISIDLETYSSIDLAKCGVFKYAESPDFEILLFAYSVDGGAVEVVDLANGENVPVEILKALTDESVDKWAYNCQFERVCLSYWLRREHPEYFIGYGIPEDSVGAFLDPSSWYCSRIWGAYLGLPMSLKDIGAVLQLENQKMGEGESLIRYFCKPCRPTETNGGRTRNLPCHAPEKWELFKKYNRRDVEVELAIKEKLARFPVPDFVWEEYHQDQEINDRGILLDMPLVEQAIAIDAKVKESLMSRIREKTGLENPNSVLQMRDWLMERGVETESLDKKAVRDLLQKVDTDVAEVLRCRQQLAKSSVSKYTAMSKAVCADSRARGMFSFYGANRTGRWCLTGDHEVLTKSGWVRLDQWNGGSIACWNASTEAVSFQKAGALQFDYTGKMYVYTDARIDQCSTPDHKMCVRKRYDAEWQDMTVEEMAKHRPSIPITGYKGFRGCADSAWLRVLIMTQADAHYIENGIVRYHFKKNRKVERCKMLLRKAEIFFLERKHKDESTVIEIPARYVPLWLRQFTGKTFGYWLFDENPDIFFDELPYWDGYYPTPNSIQYSSINKTNADIVQALAHMSGRTAVLREKKMPTNPKWSKSYIVDIWLSPSNSHVISVKPEIIEFTGKVYCAETTTGYFLIRRNGKVWVTGNSGKIVQLQNLPQNHMEDLAEARALVRTGNTEALELLYDNIPNVLSELVRTAFIPKPGYKYIVADFSAIEARVLSFLAGEQWRIDLFASGGDIYCQSASEMFGVPVVKNGVNGELRQKGKIAELACIAEGSPVLTDQGLLPIEKVTAEMQVWDGEDWVWHDGVVFRGERDVITYEGLTATPDHLVWDGSEFVPWGKIAPGKKSRSRVYDILNAGPRHRFTVSGHLVHNCGYGGSVGALKAMGSLEMGLQEEELKPLVESWRGANPNITRFWWEVDRAAMTAVEEHTTVTTKYLTFTYQSGFLFITLPSGRRLAYVKPKIGTNKFGSPSITYMGIGTAKRWERLETYGPKLVENCIQAISRDILAYAMRTLSYCHIVGSVHDELIIECDPRVSLDVVCELMGRTPPWIPGLLLRADGYECQFYQKS